MSSLDHESHFREKFVGESVEGRPKSFTLIVAVLFGDCISTERLGSVNSRIPADSVLMLDCLNLFITCNF